jgi:hypothetical protein
MEPAPRFLFLEIIQEVYFFDNVALCFYAVISRSVKEKNHYNLRINQCIRMERRLTYCCLVMEAMGLYFAAFTGLAQSSPSPTATTLNKMAETMHRCSQKRQRTRTG